MLGHFVGRGKGEKQSSKKRGKDTGQVCGESIETDGQQKKEPYQT